MTRKPVTPQLALPLSVLIVDDEEPLADSMAEGLARHGYKCRTAYAPAQARAMLQSTPPDILITDLKLEADKEGLELLAMAKQVDPKIEVILVTAFGTIDTCRSALQQGAFDYITKPLDLGEMRSLVARAAEKIFMARQIHNLREQLDEKFGFEGIVGNSPAMTRIVRTIRQVANSTIPVLLQGESGTGKELLANAIHVNSDRNGKPFVALNCAGLSESILEDELFGHVKGAFTGAAGDRKGRFEHADGGTLFLDEIGDMPANFQAKLLRVLENGEMVRLGSNEPIRVDVRLISATNRDLSKMVDDKQFRQDLYFRIKGVTVTIPPLRERRDDIPPLIEHFLTLTAGVHNRPAPTLTPAATRTLTAFDWPGNARQLKTAIETMLVLSDPEKRTLDADDIPEEISRAGPGSAASLSPSLVGISIEQAEKLLIENTLKLVNGNREQAAKMLGIGERTLYRKIKEYGLSGAEDAEQEQQT
ncbi:MAG: sigma-54 dependent transcriptional regulator [Phycisphaerae bacterium]|nr:sigma-54 dependent transcriptional regulator [Phycisphaerae bacterium]